MNSELSNKLKELSSLKKEVDNSLEEYLESLRRTPSQHRKVLNLSTAEWNKLLDIEFTKNNMGRNGSDYFDWTPKTEIKRDRSKFKLDDKQRCFIIKDHYGYELFDYMYVSENCMVRSRNIIKTLELQNDDKELIYMYNGTLYNGFGNSVGSLTQEFTIRLKDDIIIEHRNSKQSHNFSFYLSKL